ncbi:MAG TPA: HAMP domain-containing sensor histidine kinase [Nocardioidaceae bacterium]|nr:HAMP domain-containing sensor histidine kinase [Nocardioidaceae bacterium]
MRRQLAILVAATTSLVVIAFLVPLGLLVPDLARNTAVEAATQDAQNVALLVGVLGEGPRLDTTIGLFNQQSSRRTTVFLANGDTVGAAADPSPTVQEAAEGLASSTETEDGYEVLQPVATPEGRHVVRVLIPPEDLRTGVWRARLILAALGLGLVVVAMVAADRVARRVAKPLDALADATHQIGEGRLDVEVEAVGPPEVVELATVVNRLSRRIQALLAAERELVADLSHRLRTPITALRLDSEGLRNPDEARRLGDDVDMLERAVDDLIREARKPTSTDQAVDAAAIVRQRVTFWSALADDQGRTIHLDTPAVPVPVSVSGPDLAAALDALLQNALSYTPEGAAVHVRLEPRDAGGGNLTVADEGTGFDDITGIERGSSGTGSTGLGLDIARRTAVASGGQMVLDRATSGGASVRLELGPPKV